MSAGGEGRYEHSDVSARPLFLAGIVLALLLAGALLASAWFDRLSSERLKRDPVSPMQALQSEPSGPELQAIPAHELEEHRAWEERMLTGTEWVDSVNKIVRIPVERAEDLVLQEGFPVREEGHR